MADEPITGPLRMTPEQIVALARDIKARRVFGTWCGERSIDAFTFLAMAIETGAIGREFLDQVGHVYEYLDQAGERSINGLPCFMSVRFIHKEDTEPMIRALEALEKADVGAQEAALAAVGGSDG